MNYQIFSWNVNGIRAALNKGALQDFINSKEPDILCIQETKAKPGQAEVDFPEYEELWNSAERPGYSGTAIFTKTPPLSVLKNFALPGNTTSKSPSTASTTSTTSTASTPTNSGTLPGIEKLADAYGDPVSEGRVLAAEFPEFFLVTVYTPNSKPDLSRLKLREKLWDPLFLQYLKELEKTKPVVVCGDFNAAHTEIDLARPKDNEHNAGYTIEERQGITNLINAGLVDTFRSLHPDEQKYTWWTWRAQARARNIGWRIDYFFISDSLKSNLKSAEILSEFAGSDHCPISINLEFQS